jgi:catechol 2,3-dioxygenase-like lactoylglutathione lyase family enzyme
MTKLKLNSISGITCYVKDLRRTAEFYEILGFRRGNEAPGRVTCYVNWFWVTFVAQDHETGPALQKEVQLPGEGAGLFTYIKVDDVDEAYQGVLAAGMKPDGEPQKRPSGNREFILHDPDGYKLVFFQKK